MELQIVNLREAFLQGELDYYLEDIEKFKSNDNPDVEKFITNSAVTSTKMKQSVTYLIYDEMTASLVGYFTLSFKIMNVPLGGLSQKMQSDLERNGQRSDETIQVPGVLLAQWSKNYSLKELVDGHALMNFVEKYFLKIQTLAGGNFLFLECEKERKGLVESYKTSYNFTAVSERLSKDGKPLVQFIKKL